MTQTVAIAGVGPGLGESLVRRFAAEGCETAFLARSGEYLDALEADLRASGHDALGVHCDVGDPVQISEAFATIRTEFGPVETLVQNASIGGRGGLMDVSRAEFTELWETAVLGGFCCARAVVPDMRAAGSGTIIFTGASSSVRGRGDAVGHSVAKFAVRGLAQSLADELGAEGIHVAHAIVDGRIGTDDASTLDPDAIADAYWSIATQDADTMTAEVRLTAGSGSGERA